VEELARAQEEISRLIAENERLRTELSGLQSDRVHRPIVRERPTALRGLTRKLVSPLGTMYVTINEDEKGRPFEVFAALGKAGGAAMADAEAIGRLISLALRSGVPMREVWQQLRGISCDRAVGFGEKKVLSMPDAIGQAIEQYLTEKEGTQQALPLPDPASPKKPNGGRQASAPPRIGAAPPAAFAGRDAAAFINTCPECRSSQLEFAEGCMKCHVCGYTECG
jgi:ribonucleoside-diphosphate reductase alpha chain